MQRKKTGGRIFYFFIFYFFDIYDMVLPSTFDTYRRLNSAWSCTSSSNSASCLEEVSVVAVGVAFVLVY